ncbi:hypothetical protein U1701_05495 [Sphingomonas sp. PB2P19]|uniref:hypothetical protein n=1 Tax=Sphingomonas rhamnosi TaxID=3096156 RepID=UPI002FC6920E
MNQTENMMTMTYNLTWLAAVPAGWRPTLQDTVERLHAIDPTIRISQAKEKFGSLRIHIGSGSAEAHAIFDAARAKSERSCELCGADARLMRMPDGYYSIRCACHATGLGPAEEPPTVTFRIVIDGGGKDPETEGDNETSDDGERS